MNDKEAWPYLSEWSRRGIIAFGVYSLLVFAAGCYIGMSANVGARDQIEREKAYAKRVTLDVKRDALAEENVALNKKIEAAIEQSRALNAKIDALCDLVGCMK